jgi:CheY-like chemotaxis protein
MMAFMLQLNGHIVVGASNGAEAFTLARQHQPALIILDLMMPVMTGEQFRQVQLEDVEIRSIPVLVVSAHHQAREIAVRMNAMGYLPKPIDFDALDAYVRHCR